MVERTPGTTCARRVLIGAISGEEAGGYPHEIESLLEKRCTYWSATWAAPLPKGGRVSLVKCTESISNITKPNISTTNIETDICTHTHACVRACIGRGEIWRASSARIPVIVPYSKASIELLLRPVTRSFSGLDASPIRDGGGRRGLCTRAVSLPWSGSGSGDFGFRLTQTPTLQLMPGHVDLFH